ncbi:DUF3736 domain-containing protein [Caerostris extrusa]|uniref:DUF3736 domain-containing protein n=1 Tax=Caerostris extrusa TaxID=172846 RepID=A0AAV4XNF6_CAEEX|nr:DUF3736 domain-containing protein [Caerostris extrusa]
MQHPCNPPQKPRTMATVSPLHQVVPPQPNLPSFEGANLAFNATSRTSSFAAALRKLAKQAVDPVSGEKDLTQISPVSSPVLSQGSLTPKRSVSNSQPPPPAMFLTNHQVSYASSSPPVMTIAPSRPVATHTSESRKVMDLSNVQSVNNSNVLSNGHLQDSLGVKMDSSKNVSRSSHSEKWDESNLPNKGLSGSTASSQSRPHATIAPLPRPDDSLTSSRGFQPYRGTEESRNTLPHHLSLFDHPHPAASYPYTPAFLPPPHLSHPAYRFDDPLYLERYSLLRPPVMPYPQPGMMTPSAFYPNSRYAADLLAQSLSISSANNTILNHERLKQEEERRMREKEIELDQSRSKEQERQREKEQKEKENREREQKEREQREKEKKEREKSHREREEHKKHNTNYSTSSKRTESPNVRNAPVIQCAPPTVTNHISIPNTVSNPIPLNLVVQASPEPLKKEAEIWTPWQQPSTNYPKENNNQEFAKHPVFRSQEVHRHHASKDNSTSDKVNMRFSPSSTNDKRHSSIQIIDPPTPIVDAKKHSTPDNTKRFDTIHHHITELSSKEHVQHEWRHEKLQKACTNNHRKSHESKKAKEDRNNVYQNHQRKVVANGAILKPTPFQNEGMHARLLESEKCRLEMNGHALPKTHTTNTINDRLVPPNFKTNHQPITGKEIVPQKPFNDFYNAPSLKSNVDLAPVVSKLDLDAKNLKKGDMKYCEDDAKEELRLKNFLIITKVPPKKFESNHSNLNSCNCWDLQHTSKEKKSNSTCI